MQKSMMFWKFKELKNDWGKVFLCSIIILVFGNGNLIGQDYGKKEREAQILKELNHEIILLEGYLQFISNKKLDFDERSAQIQMVLKRFDKKAKIQVSRLNSNEIKSKLAEKYFIHLLHLDYDDIYIAFDQTSAGNLIPIGNNRYKADGYYLQVFIGKREGKVAYADKTKKSIEFEIIEKKKNDGTIDLKIKFLNINVLSTEELSDMKD